MSGDVERCREMSIERCRSARPCLEGLLALVPGDPFAWEVRCFVCLKSAFHGRRSNCEKVPARSNTLFTFSSFIFCDACNMVWSRDLLGIEWVLDCSRCGAVLRSCMV